MTSFPKGWDHDDVTFFPFLGISKKYNSDQNYVYNFSFSKIDDDLGRGGQKSWNLNDVISGHPLTRRQKSVVQTLYINYT